MPKYKLVKISKKIKNDLFDYLNEWREFGENHIVPSACDIGSNSFDEWLDKTKKLEKQDVDELVQSTLYAFYDGKKLIGFIQIRHKIDSYFLNTFFGHIGYGIRPSERKKGYGSLMLSFALLKAFKLGISRPLITCVKGNEASKKVILNNGGYFDKEVEYIDSKGNSKIYERYYIDFYKF